ncbi:MAG: hypothetical protein IKZ87_03580, partial [Actinomycetaceae bacterium]|nr:hypothetical protein [Actinomycetaceae bacterium]
PSIDDFKLKLINLGVNNDRLDFCLKYVKVRLEKEKQQAVKRDMVATVQLPSPYQPSVDLSDIPEAVCLDIAFQVVLALWDARTELHERKDWHELPDLVANVRELVSGADKRFPNLTMSDFIHILGADELTNSYEFEKQFPSNTTFMDLVNVIACFICDNLWEDKKVFLGDSLTLALLVEDYEQKLLPFKGKKQVAPDTCCGNVKRNSLQTELHVHLCDVYHGVMLEAACAVALDALKKYRQNPSPRGYCCDAVYDEYEENLKTCHEIAKEGKKYGSAATMEDMVTSMCGAIDGCIFDLERCLIDGNSDIGEVVYEILEIASPGHKKRSTIFPTDVQLELNLEIMDIAKDDLIRRDAEMQQWIKNRTFRGSKINTQKGSSIRRRSFFY